MQSVHPFKSSGVINGRMLTATLTHSVLSIFQKQNHLRRIQKPQSTPRKCRSNSETKELGKFSSRKFSGNAKHWVGGFEISNFEEREKEKGTFVFFERSEIIKNKKGNKLILLWNYNVSAAQVRIQIFFFSLRPLRTCHAHDQR